MLCRALAQTRTSVEDTGHADSWGSQAPSALGPPDSALHAGTSYICAAQGRRPSTRHGDQEPDTVFSKGSLRTTARF